MREDEGEVTYLFNLFMLNTFLSLQLIPLLYPSGGAAEFSRL